MLPLMHSPESGLVSRGQPCCRHAALLPVVVFLNLFSTLNLQLCGCLFAECAQWRSSTVAVKVVKQDGKDVCVQGEVLVWELESSHLAQRSLRLPAAVLEAPLSALAVHDDGSLFLGDEQGAVWRLQVCRMDLVFTPTTSTIAYSFLLMLDANSVS